MKLEQACNHLSDAKTRLRRALCLPVGNTLSQVRRNDPSEMKRKIRAALAQTTARASMTTKQIQEAIGEREGVWRALEEMRSVQEACHCRITRKLETVDNWWLAGNVVDVSFSPRRGRPAK